MDLYISHTKRCKFPPFKLIQKNKLIQTLSILYWVILAEIYLNVMKITSSILTGSLHLLVMKGGRTIEGASTST